MATTKSHEKNVANNLSDGPYYGMYGGAFIPEILVDLPSRVLIFKFLMRPLLVRSTTEIFLINPSLNLCALSLS